ncbi:DUF5591 domain-containing protein [Candidatus Harpocratesius sp.]
MNITDYINQQNQLTSLSALHQEWMQEREQNADFYSKTNQEFYASILENFNFRTTKPIIFLPCASTKPISNSRTHCYMSALTRNSSLCKIIISEPQTIIPYEFEHLCPDYDYPPNQLNQRDEWQLVRRLNIFLALLKEGNPRRKVIYYFGSKHHYKLLSKANRILNYFGIISLIPPRGIRDYAHSAQFFLKVIENLEDRIYCN